jgi:hypothetical protein
VSSVALTDRHNSLVELGGGVIKHRPKPRVRVLATQGNSDWFNLGERLITKLTTEGEYLGK